MSRVFKLANLTYSLLRLWNHSFHGNAKHCNSHKLGTLNFISALYSLVWVFQAAEASYILLLKLINNSWRKYKKKIMLWVACLEIRWKTAHFCILNFFFKIYFVWEVISSIQHSVSSRDETPRSWSKILSCASYFQLSSPCFIWWWNTASHAWYITSRLY